MSYHCNDCDMSVADLVCKNCNCKLQHDTIKKDNKTIGVSKCPQCEGMIKSPQCCGHDMKSK